MFGLNHNNSTPSYTDIDYGIYTYPPYARLLVYENGTYRGQFGAYAVGDVLRVELTAGQVRYYQNSTLFYTSTVAPIYPLVLDAAIYTVGGQVRNAQICAAGLGPSPTPTLPGTATATRTPYSDSGPVTWKSRVATQASGGTLTKPSVASVGWNAGAISDRVIQSGNGDVQATVAAINTLGMFGLSHGNSNATYQDIDYALYTYATNHTLLVYEGGAYRGSFGSYTVGDVLKVAVANGVVRYYKNGGLLYTSGVAATYPLLVDSSLYTPDAQILNATLTAANLVPTGPLPGDK